MLTPRCLSNPPNNTSHPPIPNTFLPAHVCTSCRARAVAPPSHPKNTPHICVLLSGRNEVSHLRTRSFTRKPTNRHARTTNRKNHRHLCVSADAAVRCFVRHTLYTPFYCFHFASHRTCSNFTRAHANTPTTQPHSSRNTTA